MLPRTQHLLKEMAIKLGITGGIGSGKSCVSNLLRVMGVPVYDCDKEASRLMNSSEKIRRELIRLAGSDVYDEQGGLNRRLLAAYMFGHADRVEKVNAIVHPSVREDFSRWNCNLLLGSLFKSISSTTLPSLIMATLSQILEMISMLWEVIKTHLL